jgi:hypothetical protein
LLLLLVVDDDMVVVAAAADKADPFTKAVPVSLLLLLLALLVLFVVVLVFSTSTWPVVSRGVIVGSSKLYSIACVGLKIKIEREDSTSLESNSPKMDTVRIKRQSSKKHETGYVEK